MVVESGKQSKKAEVTLKKDGDERPLDDTEVSVRGGPSRKELEGRVACAMMEAEDEVLILVSIAFLLVQQLFIFNFTAHPLTLAIHLHVVPRSCEPFVVSGAREERRTDDEDEDVSTTRPSSVPRNRPSLQVRVVPCRQEDCLRRRPLSSAEAASPRKRRRTKRTLKDVLLWCAYIYHRSQLST